MMRTAMVRMASATALMLVAGCVGLGGKAPKQLISLTTVAPATAGDFITGKAGDTLVVLNPEADRRLDVQRVVVQVDASTVAYLKDAAWADRPARQFRRLLAETIRGKGGRLVLEAGDTEAVSKDTLAGRLIDMGYDARSKSVVVRYDAIRNKADGTVAARRFETSVPGVAPKAEQVAAALNKAANQVAAQVADWVTAPTG